MRKVSAPGRKYRSELLDASPFIYMPSSSSISSFERQQIPADDFPKAHTYSLTAASFWNELKAKGELNDDATSKAFIKLEVTLFLDISKDSLFLLRLWFLFLDILRD